MFSLLLPNNSTLPLPEEDGEISREFGYRTYQKNGVADLLGEDHNVDGTAHHYSQQWGPGIAFLEFIKANPEALRHMPSGQLGWPDLIARIRGELSEHEVLVYDAACGYGGLFSQLTAEPRSPYLHYLGADIHCELATIARPIDVKLSAARFVRWDISKPLPIAERFDFVVCRNALMHTPIPSVTLRSVAAALKVGGTIAVSVYARKALLRELLDDALRERIVPLPSQEAFVLARQFALLGRDLRDSGGQIVVKQDLPFFGIKAGDYDIHSFIYDHIVKCWYNDIFGEKYSDVVNFDWYHPPFAYRFTQDEVLALFSKAELQVTKASSSTAQHYVEAIKIA